MRNPRRLAPLFLTIGALCQPAVAHTQQRPASLAGLHAGLLSNTGYQFAGHLGRSLATGFAGLAEVAVTTVRGPIVAYPCTFPGCTAHSTETGLSFAAGLQFYNATDAGRVALTLTPGAVWFVSHARGSGVAVAKIGLRFDVGWPLGNGPLVGLSFGAEWWGSHGTTPRWVVPIGVVLTAR